MNTESVSADAVAAVPETVRAAIAESSASTGADFGYLMRVAERESHFRSAAHAPNSSAAGVFQFNEQTWLHMVKTYGAKYGLAGQAKAIVVNPQTGRHEVPGTALRRSILAERNDPKLSALMAGELAQENRSFLEKRLGRPATEGEVYAAHIFGANGALRLIRASDEQPGQKAAPLLKAAARTNHNLFYEHGSNRSRSAGQVMARLDAIASGRDPIAGRELVATSEDEPVDPPMAVASNTKQVPLPRSRPSDWLSPDAAMVLASN